MSSRETAVACTAFAFGGVAAGYAISRFLTVACGAFAVGGTIVGFLFASLLRRRRRMYERRLASQMQVDFSDDETGAGLMGEDAKSGLSLLMEAIHFSSEKHKDQRRKNPEQHPYINHPIRVARLLASEAGIRDLNVIIAALLHDTVEDTDTTLEEIHTLFGPQVAQIIDEVTDDKSLPKAVRKQMQIDHAPKVCRQAKLVKLADKLDNLLDLLSITPIGWPPERVLQYFAWSEKVIDGLRGTNVFLEQKLDTVLSQRDEAASVAERGASVFIHDAVEATLAIRDAASSSEPATTVLADEKYEGGTDISDEMNSNHSDELSGDEMI